MVEKMYRMAWFMLSGALWHTHSDAVNKTDTAHTLLGREQCDEDDYG
jgi:hypothetical protein